MTSRDDGAGASPGPARSPLLELARPPLGSVAVACLVVDGRPRLHGAAHDAPADVETRFNLASVSKLFTAARVVSLAAAGRLSLDDPLASRLPGVRLVDEAGADRTGEVTLRRLLEHRAGLPRQGDVDPARVGSAWDDPGVLTRMTEAWTIPLAGAPGDYRYSNLGYALLGAVVERVEGAPFREAMQAWLDGLGLDGVTFDPARLGSEAASGRVERDGKVELLPPSWYGSAWAAPYSGAWASARELASFGELLLRAAGDPADPLRPMTQLEAERGHGLGPVVGTRLGARSLEHDGGSPGFLACLIVVPERRLVLALACNGDGEVRANGLALQRVADALLGESSGR